MNIYDIANKAGVSIATVSRVLNGSGKVRPETEELIRKIIAEENYLPRQSRHFAGCIRTAAIMIKDVLTPSNAHIVESLSKELEKKGITVRLCLHGNDRTLFNRQLIQCQKDNLLIAYAITCDFGADKYTLPDTLKLTMPMVLINSDLNIPGAYHIDLDRESSLKKLAESCVSSGHSRICCLFSSMNRSNMALIDAITDVLKVSTAALPPGFFHLIDKDSADAGIYIEKLLSSEDPPNALIASDSLLAAHALKILKQKDIRIPVDFEIACAEYSFLSEAVYPEITGLDLLDEEVAELSVTLLSSLMTGKEVSLRSVVKADIIYGESTLNP